MFNSFDMSFLLIFFVYLGLRLHGLLASSLQFSEWAFDVLACGAAILFPRLAFTVVQGDVVLIALKAMFVDFAAFMSLAVISFTGACSSDFEAA